MSAHQLNIPDESLHVDVYQSLSEPVVEDCPPVLCGGFQGTEAQRFKTLKHTQLTQQIPCDMPTLMYISAPVALTGLFWITFHYVKSSPEQLIRGVQHLACLKPIGEPSTIKCRNQRRLELISNALFWRCPRAQKSKESDGMRFEHLLKIKYISNSFKHTYEILRVLRYANLHHCFIPCVKYEHRLLVDFH